MGGSKIFDFTPLMLHFDRIPASKLAPNGAVKGLSKFFSPGHGKAHELEKEHITPMGSGSLEPFCLEYAFVFGTATVSGSVPIPGARQCGPRARISR